MDNRYYTQIYRRRSFHSFRDCGNASLTGRELEEIEAAWLSFEPLYPDIRTRIVIVPESETTSKRGGEYCILIYSENRDGYLQNVGYLGEQLDLYLVSRNIGTLWLGMGKTREKQLDGMDFVIMFEIRKIEDPDLFKRDIRSVKRKPVDRIWEGDRLGEVAQTARLAPSAMNSQPWYVKCDGKTLTVYRHKEGLLSMLPSNLVPFHNRIDIGIFLLILELCLYENGAVFERELFSDSGSRAEFTKVAEYKLTRAFNLKVR
ncbi:MAG: nitroreductase [Oscillospiraceae bacterium]|nr:nitroreductase [Oscillospiraceae bacterium]